MCVKGLAGTKASSSWTATGCMCVTGQFTHSETYVPALFACGTLTATGSTQGTAAAIVKDHTDVTTGTLQFGVILPSACDRLVIHNVGPSLSCTVYPPVGESISPNMVNVGFSVLNGQTYMFVRQANGVWVKVQLT
jgi:hypothetical protein